MKSSIACSILGTSAIFLLILSLLTYLGAGIPATMFLLAIAVLVAVPSLKSTFRLWKISKQLIELRDDFKNPSSEKSVRSMRFSERQNGDNDIGPSESEGIYITSERYRVTRPTRWFAFAMFGAEVFFLFFWPLVSYFSIGT